VIVFGARRVKRQSRRRRAVATGELWGGMLKTGRRIAMDVQRRPSCVNMAGAAAATGCCQVAKDLVAREQDKLLCLSTVGAHQLES
jgi:hypothetical protein